ncbi:hypothetical protein FE391_29920 [Nonomuraea sp. KC401]|uniref:hypothetical protein n=1 Tax=unclassified Nonomuraea TaxID=2593643 RepID=UPI0010FE9A40|nr:MULTISPECIES: hypothetical protein [unclassified Nonomuraea]NBE97508.1 hypothetical protein [Nonomuraea sp. K271]TLF62628.1 hypothetical protein FE391_29920 [Nonomuraea sp. KC401]
MKAYAEDSGQPQRWSFYRPGRRRRTEVAVRTAEEARKQSERLSAEITERLDGLRAAVDERLDRLSADVAQLKQSRPTPAPTEEEELGRLLVAIMDEGHYAIWFHTKIAQFVTGETVQGARLAARTVLGASREKPLPEWAVRAFAQLAEDPLHASQPPT